MTKQDKIDFILNNKDAVYPKIKIIALTNPYHDYRLKLWFQTVIVKEDYRIVTQDRIDDRIEKATSKFIKACENINKHYIVSESDVHFRDLPKSWGKPFIYGTAGEMDLEEQKKMRDMF